jgi:hypothetical protein
MTLSADELLAGSALTYEIGVPSHVLTPGANGAAPDAPNGHTRTMRLRPLTVHDLQLISRAAKENGDLVATLMVQQAIVEPAMTVPQVAAMHVGLMQFLLHHVTRISGIATSADHLAAAVDAPLAKAAFVLAREFGWTPREMNELTLGQIALHLQMLKERAQP